MEKHYETAEDLINDTVDGSGGSPDGMLQKLDAEKTKLEVSEAAQVASYVQGVRRSVQGMIVNDLEAGIGGVYTGDRVEISTSVLMVGDSIEQTIAEVQETSDHEKYHERHHHLDPIALGASASGAHVVRIGGEGFTDTRMVEALTVHETGSEFVSAEYIEHERAVAQALVRASLGWDDVRDAINVKKDYGVLDDLSRNGASSAEPALSA